MNRNTIIIAAVVMILSSLGGFCWFVFNRSNMAIQAVDNATDKPFDFYAQVLDQDGQPLPNVKFMYTINRFRSNWAFDGNMGHRDDDYNAQSLSNSQGKIHINETGHQVIITSLALPGYAYLHEKLGGNPYSPGERAVFELYTHGQKGAYEPDPNRPAIFVMVKNGVKTVTTRPSPGGSGPPTRPGIARTTLQPRWPKAPSIDGVLYVPSTQISE